MLILMLKALFTASIPMERPVFAPSVNTITKQILLEHLAELGKEMLLTRNESKCKTKVMGSGWGGHTLCDSGHPDITIVAGGMPGDRDFQASQDLMSRPHLARAVAVLRRVLDARADSTTAPGSRLQSPTMWMASGQPAWRLARLKHFVGEASTVVVDVGR